MQHEEVNMKKGDIIIFKAEDCWFSKAIAILSHSDVCHAAMAYTEDSITENLADGVQVNRVLVSEGDDVYVLRLASEPDAGPLLCCADDYLQNKNKYDFPGLVLLGGLLIYRYILPTPKILKIADRIIDAACLKLDLMIQNALHYKGRAMVCSQYIYQIFNDCGDEYKIKIIGGCLWNDADSASGENNSYNIRLFDYLSNNQNGCNCTSSFSDYLKEGEEETLCEELCVAFSEAEKNEQQGNCDKELEGDKVQKQIAFVAQRAEGFCSRFKHFLELINCDMPMDAMFVTPGDILNHSTNLKRVEMVSLKRV